MVDLKNFVCERCGKCCLWSGYVRLKESEIDGIADHLGLPVDEFIENHTRLTRDRTSLSLNELEDGSCIFYSKTDGGCEIESVKPLQCRNFPMNWNFPNWEKTCQWGKNHVLKEDSTFEEDENPPEK